MRNLRYKHTILACYVGYITQAIINNFAPLLFLTFQSTFLLSLKQVTLLVTFNFLTQLVVDFLAAKFVDQIGYRPCVVAAHVFCAVGLVGLGWFPAILPPYTGLLLAVVAYAIGGGLIEVLISPIVEACPTENKSAAMSLLHSFYCWGTVAVVLLSTVLFSALGMESWRLVGCLWALIPAFNALLFLRVPIAPIVSEGEGMSISGLFRQKIFWILALLMVCAGASEQAMSQWASAFAESGLQVSKTMGDLAGPCFFSILMGTARVVHAKLARRVNLESYIVLCALLCISSYVLAVLPLHPLVNLLGCGLCGFSVGVFWPGTFSIATKACPLGGTAMFALLALAGDLGCSLGPTVVGFVSAAFDDVLKMGLVAAIGFPALILLGIRLLRSRKTT